MITESDMVVLTRDLDAHGLKLGDIGTVVHKYGKKGFEIEFVTAEGKTVAVLTLQKDDVRPFHGKDILHVREMSQTMNA